MLLYSLIGMFKKTTSKDSKIKDIVKFLKLLPESQIDQVTEALLYGRISAVANTRLVEDSTQTAKIISNDEAPLETVTKEIMQKTKIDSPVWRYFLRDSTKKGVVSARISKITGGKKAVWKQSKNGNKDEYVAGIEGMKSDEVDKVMAQFKNLNTYFNKSAFRARIWSRQ